MDAIEAMETCTAMRWLKADPVPKEDLEQLIYAATRASNPGNSQAWQFIILTDTEKKERIGASIAERMAPAFVNKPTGLDPSQERMYLGAEHLANNFAKIPAWVFIGARNVYPPHQPNEIFVHSAIYPAAQNLIVAARAMGLGTTFTTFHMTSADVVRDTLNVPDDVHLGVTIAVGYPERKFGPVKRKPVDDVLHWNEW